MVANRPVHTRSNYFISNWVLKTENHPANVTTIAGLKK